jgi:hypothetical protein
LKAFSDPQCIYAGIKAAAEQGERVCFSFDIRESPRQLYRQENPSTPTKALRPLRRGAGQEQKPN